MNIQTVKQGARITLYNGIYMIILGIFIMFFVNFNMAASFNSISQLWGFFLKYNSNISFILILFNVMLGLMMVSQGVSIIYLSDFIIKRKEKMTWVILFISGIISWLGVLIIFILMRNWILSILTFLGWLTFVTGMLIPIQYYLEKPYKEY